MPAAAAATSTAAQLFSSLLEAKSNSDAASAERVYLEHLPAKLSIFGSIFAYGMQQEKSWARWTGGAGLVWIGIGYLAARRRTQLATRAAAPARARVAIAPRPAPPAPAPAPNYDGDPNVSEEPTT